MGRPRNGKPWLRKSDNCYYTTVGRTLVKVGKGGDSPEKIQQAYHAVLAGLQRPTDPSVQRIIREFLDYCQRHRSAATYEWYKDFLDPFKTSLRGQLLPEKLKPSMVSKWIEKQYGGKSASTRNGAARAVTRAMNWAVTERMITVSPLNGFVKPSGNSREVTITPHQYRLCLRHAKDEFGDVVKFLWHTGCRPQELRILEANWLGDDKFVLPVSKSKGKKKRRVIFMNAKAREIAHRLCCEYYEGPIFRNSRGQPWTKSGLNTAFRRLKAKTGIEGLCAYALRHGFATETLKRGVDTTTVSVLMGNSPRMVAEVYQHVNQDDAYMLRVLNGGSTSA